MECNPTVYKEKIDNKVIQVEGEILSLEPKPYSVDFASQ